VKKDFFEKDKILDYIFYLIVIMSGIYQLSMWGLHCMHMDETLYVNWALKIADGTDFFLHNTTTDKFPLLSYMIAFFIKLFGNSEATARIPSFICTIGGFFVLYRAAELLYDKRTGVLAVLATALTKYFVIYGPTAFTDQIMMFFILLSLLMFAEKKYFWTGIFIGISAMAKLTGLYFFLPFAIGIILLNNDYKRSLIDFAKGIALMCLIIFLWAGLVELNAFRLFLANSPIPYKGTIDLNFFKDGLNIIKDYQFNLMGGAKLIAAIIGGLVLISLKNSHKKTDIIIFLTVILFYFTLAIMTFRRVPIFERYLVVIVPFITLLLARTAVYLYDLLGPKNKVFGFITASIFMLFALLPFNKTMDIAAFYSVNDGLDTAINSIPDKQKAVALNMGIHYCVALYYYYDFANFYGNIYGIATEKEIVKNYTRHDEGREKYIIANNDGAKVVNEDIKIINGVYYDHKPILKNITYFEGKPKYYVYKLEKVSKLKVPFIALKKNISPSVKMNVNYAKGIQLLGFDYRKLSENKIEFTYYWKKTGIVKKAWRVDVHFNDVNKQLQDGDHYPAHGLAMFDSLEIGDVIQDKDIVDFDKWKAVNNISIELHLERSSKVASYSGKNRQKIAF